MECLDGHPCIPELCIIGKVSQAATSAPDLQQLLQTTLDEGLEAVGGNRGFIALVDVDRGELVVQCTAGSGWDTEKTTKRLLLHTGEQKGITTFVAATGKPHRTGDVHNDPYYIPTFDDVQSEIAVPILDKLGRARGVLNVESPDRDAFEERHEAILMALANIASLGIAVNRHRNRERAFVEIGTELVSSIDIPTLISKVIKVAGDVLRFEDCSVFMLDRDRHTLTLEASRGPLKQEVGDATYRMGEGLTGWIAEHGLPIRVTDPRADPRWRGLHEEIPPEEMGAYLGVPIESRNGVIGVLRVLRKKSKFPWFQNEFTEDDQSVLISIASQVAAAIQNLRLMDRVVNAERMAAWGEMSARSAHMMGNRLFAIKGDLNELNYQLSQTASGGGSDSGGHGDPPLQDADAERERHLELVQSVQKGVFRLEEMLTEFRDFVMATQISLSEQDVNLLVKESIDEFFPKRSSVRLEVGLTPDLPIIQADSTKLKRCFAELIENAVSFQTDGGLLRLSTVPAASKEARDLCGLSSKKKYIRLEFADAGPGIPEDDKQKIFTPFFTSRAKGMGLGLSIVKGIIEAHRGGICEIGSEGTGARFVIFLPVER